MTRTRGLSLPELLVTLGVAALVTTFLVALLVQGPGGRSWRIAASGPFRDASLALERLSRELGAGAFLPPSPSDRTALQVIRMAPGGTETITYRFDPRRQALMRILYTPDGTPAPAVLATGLRVVTFEPDPSGLVRISLELTAGDQLRTAVHVLPVTVRAD